MALRASEQSAAAIEAISGEVADLSGHPEYRERYLGGAPGERELQLAAPHPVYALGLRELAAGPSIAEVELVGQRCLVMSDDDAIATAEVIEPGRGGGGVESANVATTRGPFTESTLAAIDVAEDFDEVGARDYELRLLRIPALYLMSLWLYDEEGDDDLFLPLAPVPDDLEPNRRYSWDDLTGALRERARQRLEMDEEASA